MLLTDSNSRGSRIAKNVLNVVIICAVFVTAAHFKNSVASDDNDWATQQIETMQGIRQTAQDSVAFAQGMENPDEYAAQIENVQQYITDYDQLAKTREIQSVTTHDPVQRALGSLNRNRQQEAVANMQNTASNLDKQTKTLLDAVDKTMADDFTQHGGQWLLQVDDPTQVNELIDRYGKNRHYASMQDLLTDLKSLQKLRTTVKQQVSDAVANLHDAEGSAAAIAVPTLNGDLDPAGWYTLATNVAGTMGVQIEQTMEYGCGGQTSGLPQEFTVAYYCQSSDRAQRNVVHILTTHPSWTQTARSPWLVDVVKHELSHRSIMISCGTIQPTIAGDRTEAVTNSYSVLYFGADRGRIAEQQQGLAEYAMDEQSDQIASSIHDGNCG